MKLLYMIIFVLTFAFATSNSQWNQVFDINMMQWDLDCADSLNCISLGNKGLGMVNARTTDGGYRWFIQTADTQKVIYNNQGQVVDVIPTKFKGARCIDFVTTDLVVVGHLEGQIAISRDGGVTWDSTNLNTQDFKIIKFTDSLSGIALTNNYIFLTTDGGDNWENITGNFNYSGVIFFNSAYIKDDFIYAGGFFSFDKGKTWTQSNPVYNISSMNGVYFINNFEGWCGGRKQISNQIYSHVILHTTDSGKNWVTQMDTSVNNIGLVGGIYFTDENHGLAWGESVVWLTTNGGNNWYRDPNTKTIVNNSFNKMVFPNRNFNKRIANTYLAGTIWLYEDLTSVNENELNIGSINIFPNPTHDFITITFSNKELQLFAEEEKVQIFDVLGIEIGQSSLIDNTTNNNSQSGMIDLLRIDVSHLPAGVFFIRIGTRIEKFVKM